MKRTNLVLVIGLALAQVLVFAPTARAQYPQCQIRSVTYNVSAWGTDALFVHSDLNATLDDASGNPNPRGTYLKVSRGPGSSLSPAESFQPIGSVLDALMPGQTQTVSVSPNNGLVRVLFNICWQ